MLTCDVSGLADILRQVEKLNRLFSRCTADLPIAPAQRLLAEVFPIENRAWRLGGGNSQQGRHKGDAVEARPGPGSSQFRKRGKHVTKIGDER